MTKDYISEKCIVEYLSDMTAKEAESMIGKTIAKVEAREYNFTLIFTDGSRFDASGSRWEGCSMGAEYTEPK